MPEARPGVRCPTGEARITPGFDLPARFVIHTVGPVWQGGAYGEPKLLASCYQSSLALAKEIQVQTIAFPAISCGVFGYPISEAAKIAVREVLRFLRVESEVLQVSLVAFDGSVAADFHFALESAQGH